MTFSKKRNSKATKEQERSQELLPEDQAALIAKSKDSSLDESKEVSAEIGLAEISPTVKNSDEEDPVEESLVEEGLAEKSLSEESSENRELSTDTETLKERGCLKENQETTKDFSQDSLEQPKSTQILKSTNTWTRAIPVNYKNVVGILGVLLGLLLLGQTAALFYHYGLSKTAYQPQILEAKGNTNPSPEEVFKLASPSVVTIETSAGSSGSGFFYAPQKVMTNAHVVAMGVNLPSLKEVRVRLEDGRTRNAVVEKVDRRMDIALLRVENTKDIKPLSFSDSENLRTGQEVLAIGSPLGLYNSLSRGIVSSPSRMTIFKEDAVQSVLIQTDAAINPGNSGGPLLNTNGQVVGITTLRPDTAAGRSVTGVSFAIPSKLVLASKKKLEKSLEAKYVIIGITGRTTNPDDTRKGMYVESITKDGAADKAGIQKGDIIIRLGKEDVSGFEDLSTILLTKEPNEKEEAVIFRNKKEINLSLVLEERPEGS